MIVWKFDGLYKGDAEKCFSEIQSIGESATPQQNTCSPMWRTRNETSD